MVANAVAANASARASRLWPTFTACSPFSGTVAANRRAVVLPAGYAAQEPSPNVPISVSCHRGRPLRAAPGAGRLRERPDAFADYSHCDFSGNGDLPELTPEKTPEEADQRATAC